MPRLRGVIFDWGGTLTPWRTGQGSAQMDDLLPEVGLDPVGAMRAIWIPHSEILAAQQVSVDVTPDAVARELLDVFDIVDGWQAR